MLHQPPNRTETILNCSLGDVSLFLGPSTREKQRQGVPSTADSANTSTGTTLQTTARERSCMALCTRTPSKNGYHSAYFTRYSTTPARYRAKKIKNAPKYAKTNTDYEHALNEIQEPRHRSMSTSITTRDYGSKKW